MNMGTANENMDIEMEQNVPLDVVPVSAETKTDAGQPNGENKAGSGKSNWDNKQTEDITGTETKTDDGNTNVIDDAHKLEDGPCVDATVKDITGERIDDEMCAKLEEIDEKVGSSVETNTEQLPGKETGNEPGPESVSDKIEKGENIGSDGQGVGDGTTDDSNEKSETEKTVLMQTDVTEMEVGGGGDAKIGDGSDVVNSQDVPKNGAGGAQVKELDNENQNDVNKDVQDSEVDGVVERETAMETGVSAEAEIDAKQCDGQSAENDTETEANVKETENAGGSTSESATGTNGERIEKSVDLEGSEVKVIEGATQTAEVLGEETAEEGKTNDGNESPTEIAKPVDETNNSTNIDVTKDESQVELKTGESSSVEIASSGGGNEDINVETLSKEPMESEQEMEDDASKGTVGENVNGNVNEEKENKSELANGTSSTEEDDSVKTNGEVEKMSDEDVKVKILEGGAESTPVSVEV